MDDIEDLCSDPIFRLCVYEAGHALVARVLGRKIHYIRMLPRPPMTVTEKVFQSNDWGSFYGILEDRVMELLGGQLAEQIMCGATVCCSGDVSRMDEITRIMAGITEGVEHEDIYFDLEDRTQEIFNDPRVREAIIPLAKLLFAREEVGDLEIDGGAVEALIDEYIPPPPEENASGMRGLLRKLGVG